MKHPPDSLAAHQEAPERALFPKGLELGPFQLEGEDVALLVRFIERSERGVIK